MLEGFKNGSNSGVIHENLRGIRDFPHELLEALVEIYKQEVLIRSSDFRKISGMGV